MKRTHAVGAAVLAMSALFVRPSEAAVFRAYGAAIVIFNGQQTLTPYDVTDPVRAGGGIGVTPSDELAVSSQADIGGLHAHGFGQIREQHPTQPLGYDLVYRGAGSARARFDGVVISGPSGPVTTSFNMRLSGQYEALSTATATGNNGGSASVGVAFWVDGSLLPGFPGSILSGHQNLSSTGGGPAELLENGALVGWRPPEDDITSPPFTVQAGTPFTLELELQVSGAAGAGFRETAFIASGNADFGNTLRFVPDRAVFNLPPGYTADAPDAGITDNRVACVSDCAGSRSSCDAGKLTCVAKRQACLLKAHSTAERNGEPPDATAMQKCADAFDGGSGGPAQGCIGKLEGKQNPAKPHTLCTVTDDLAALEGSVDAFVADVVSAIHPGFPAVGPASTCDAGKKTCVQLRAGFVLRKLARAAKKGELADAATLQKCTDPFDGGANGATKGCLGKLEDKQNLEKPKTLCTVTGDLTTLENVVDAFVEDVAGTVFGTD
jgi:hypothetical protein